jgi:Zn-finger nucleic acid-binding protein
VFTRCIDGEVQRVDAAAPVIVLEPRTLSCAHCRARMQRHIIEGVEVDECTGCGLRWFDVGELATVIAARTSWSVDALGPSRSPVQSSEPCAVCRRQTTAFRFHAVPHLHVAACDEHGNWLDEWQGRELTLWGRKEARLAEAVATRPYQRRFDRLRSSTIVYLASSALALRGLSFESVLSILALALWAIDTCEVVVAWWHRRFTHRDRHHA